MEPKSSSSNILWETRHRPYSSSAKIIQKKEKSLLVEEDNTIYEIDKKCAFQRGLIR